MKKIFLICCISFLTLAQETLEIIDDNTSSTAQIQKQKNGNFVAGIFIGSQILSLDTDYYMGFIEIENIDNTKTTLGLNYAIKFGYDFLIHPKQYIRLYADYSGASLFANLSSGNTTLHNITLNIDYRYNISDLIGVFIGANGGGILIDTQHLGFQSAVSAGINLGMIFNLLSYMELELRLRFMDSTLKEKNVALDTTAQNIGATSQKSEFGDFISTALGVNFKF